MTQRFKDSLGRQWTVSIKVSSAKRVQDECGINLLRLLDDPQSLDELANNPLTLVDCIYAIVRPQVEDAGLSFDQFCDGLDGQSMDDATVAFIEALVDFFPGARKAMLRKVADRALSAIDRNEKAMREMIASGKVDEALGAMPQAGTPFGK